MVSVGVGRGTSVTLAFGDRLASDKLAEEIDPDKEKDQFPPSPPPLPSAGGSLVVAIGFSVASLCGG